MDELIYRSLLKRAAGILNRHKNCPLDPEALVSETFLIDGYENDEEVFSKNMWKLASNSTVNSYKKPENKLQEDRICKRCGERKESGWFRTWFLRGFLIHDSYCKPCKNIVINESKKRKRERVKRAKNNRNET